MQNHIERQHFIEILMENKQFTSKFRSDLCVVQIICAGCKFSIGTKYFCLGCYKKTHVHAVGRKVTVNKRGNNNKNNSGGKRKKKHGNAQWEQWESRSWRDGDKA